MLIFLKHPFLLCDSDWRCFIYTTLITVERWKSDQPATLVDLQSVVNQLQRDMQQGSSGIQDLKSHLAEVNLKVGEFGCWKFKMVSFKNDPVVNTAYMDLLWSNCGPHYKFYWATNYSSIGLTHQIMFFEFYQTVTSQRYRTCSTMSVAIMLLAWLWLLQSGHFN